MTAGRFASLTLLSAKALRIYADRGLLAPYWVDPANGYRYYAPDQVRTGWLIRLLRSAGLSLEEIGQIIGADPDTGLRHLERSAAALQHRTEAMLAVLNRVRLHLRQEVTMSHVSMSLEVDRPVLSVLRRMRPEQMEALIPPEVGRSRPTPRERVLEGRTGRQLGWGSNRTLAESSLGYFQRRRSPRSS